jgi:signal transduction histidine kinase
VAAQLRRARLALDDLLAAPTGDRVPEAFEPVPMAAFVAQVARTWEPVAGARDVALLVDAVPGTGAVVHADRTRLLQAAGNLIANALDHGHGPVELRVRTTGGMLRFEVRDGGPGLPAPVAELVRRPARGEHGHGLAIAAGIAERHGGRVVAAPSPRGAAVVLELPLAGGSSAAEPSEARA